MPAAFKYSDNYGEKKLNEVVMAGSHDAGITSGGQNAKTQELNIYEQANAGIRIFDIRVTGAGMVTEDRGKHTTLATYHGHRVPGFGKDTKTLNLVRDNVKTGKKVDVVVENLHFGNFGMTLETILKESKQFVEDNKEEFLILKFDKCTNWKLIAEACVRQLGTTICKLRGNLNEKKLSELAGSVIVCFPEAGRKATGWIDPAGFGILGWQNLSKASKTTDLPEIGSSGGYRSTFDGIQYYGGGGTAVFTGAHKGFASKLKENFKTQAKKMQKGAATDPKVLGMMYWTTTGLKKSIKDRNDFMWNDENAKKMVELWESRIPKNIDSQSAAAAAVLKQFMANFVMIDFAEPQKCRKIYDLNALGATTLSKAVRDYYDVQEPYPV